MRRALAWSVVVGVVVLWAGVPGHARAEGFWVTLAAGAAGGSSPSDYAEFWFDSPHAPPLVVNQVTGTANIQATTGGGNTFFGGDGTPVLLPTGDGYATLTNRDVPNGSGGLPRFAGGNLASGVPQTGVALPTDANLLSANLGDPAGDGSRVLTIGVTDANGNLLGRGEVTLPDGGWWVVGLGPGAGDTDNPDPPDPIGGGDDDDDDDPPVVVPTPPNQGGTVGTPEPASLVLLGIGGLSVAGWRRLRRKRTKTPTRRYGWASSFVTPTSRPRPRN
jgi:hypothetical protein